jgi:phosphoribosyl 1,2-cyclic phosphodiesterase
MSLSLQVFGSSSAGNCTAVWNRHGAILIDCGFPPGYVLQKLHAAGLASSSVRTVLLTHMHSDHLNERTLSMLLDAGAALVCTPPVCAVLRRRSGAARKARERGLLHEIIGGMTVGHGISVRPFSVPHDADGGCSGFCIDDDSAPRARRAVVATDLGYPREGLHAEFSDADVMVMESNHDVDMLEHSGRPRFLIERIRKIGHLSNDQSSRFLAEVLQRSSRHPSHIVLAHLSTQCNTPRLALEAAGSALGQIGASGVALSTAPPHDSGRALHI